MKTDLPLPHRDERVSALLDAWGTPYSWGAGRPTITGWPRGLPGTGGGIGYDCSGFAQAALVRLGILREGMPDRTAAGLFDATRPLRPDEAPQTGDLCFYGRTRIGHVTVILGPECAIGANGGTSRTNGDDPSAYVDLCRPAYRRDFGGIRTFRP